MRGCFEFNIETKYDTVPCKVFQHPERTGYIVNYKLNKYFPDSGRTELKEKIKTYLDNNPFPVYKRKTFYGYTA